MAKALNMLWISVLSASAARAVLVCSTGSAVAGNGDVVDLRVYGFEDTPDATVTWSATGGKLQPKGWRADWTFSGVTPLTMYSVKAIARRPGRGAEECS